ncbi:hypothetical protein [Natranaeroarchaeum sulfidigenes]|uniref:Uncharacterized protein n=1 Tax=Natranaeroarchaeum sulfidigenes TaxID=2784880 RepID=A0A897MY32_9EURY|nr:hypothetical protein [Natranaeroarchaeum sulfidigenes]QSG03819.1 hypothetical protein AArcS_2623 [Natranaeroarchaeum sulfidigenes]
MTSEIGRRLDDETGTSDVAVHSLTDDERVARLADVLVERVGSRALAAVGAVPTRVAAVGIVRRRLRGDAPPLSEIVPRGCPISDVMRAEDVLLDALDDPADDAVIDRLHSRVSRCRAVLIVTARERVGPPRLTSVLCEDDPEEVAVAAGVEPLPPAADVEAFKSRYHRLRADLRTARLGVALDSYLVDAELSPPGP